MNITIHRGTNQIGGCVTEYEHNGWRVFVDYGEQLPGSRLTLLSAEGLTHGDLSKSILLTTPAALPTYRKSYQCSWAQHQRKSLKHSQNM